MARHFVFTYGTLLYGERNHHLMDDENFLSEGRIKGFKMFNLGTYPGIEYGDGEVLGELYIVDDETLARLDYLEEEGTLYRREKTRIYTAHNEYDAFVYVYNLEVTDPVYIKNEYNVYSWKKR
jgi:gamma-glutamylcyclotransferase (GGCT)/AIG2-like uncharacterized protein YtfP